MEGSPGKEHPYGKTTSFLVFWGGEAWLTAEGTVVS